MNTLRAAITASILMLPALAAAQDVKIDFDKAFDFSTVKTYSITIGTTWGNDLVAAPRAHRVRRGDRRQGLEEGRRQPEHHRRPARRHRRPSATPARSTAAWVGYGYRGFGGMGTATTVVSEYTVGTLVVDMFDAKNKNLVFRGTAEDEISDNPDKNKKRLEKASTKMFKNFPPARRRSDESADSRSSLALGATMRSRLARRLAAAAADFERDRRLPGRCDRRPPRANFSKAAGSSNRWSSLRRVGSRSR